MVKVTLSPEGLTSLKQLPQLPRKHFDRLVMRMIELTRLRLPGEFETHRLEGGNGLWTLRAGQYRGIFRWDGHEVRFVRFGHRSSVYQRLPK